MTRLGFLGRPICRGRASRGILSEMSLSYDLLAIEAGSLRELGQLESRDSYMFAASNCMTENGRRRWGCGQSYPRHLDSSS
jgi:hypothetical protein